MWILHGSSAFMSVEERVQWQDKHVHAFTRCCTHTHKLTWMHTDKHTALNIVLLSETESPRGNSCPVLNSSHVNTQGEIATGCDGVMVSSLMFVCNIAKKNVLHFIHSLETKCHWKRYDEARSGEKRREESEQVIDWKRTNWC